MAYGTIVRVVEDRGFCFIRCDGRDYFAHCSEFDPELDWDERLRELRVEFDVKAMPDGRDRAVRVRKADR